MKYKVILEKNNYALILRKEKLNEIAVVFNLDKTNGVWGHTVDYMDYEDKNKAYALSIMLDLFRSKTEENYISRYRLEELATLFKDGLIEDDKESAMEYFEDYCEMTDEEKEWFGIDEDSTIENTKFENPMYNKGYDDGFSDGANDTDIESEVKIKNMIKNDECINSDEYLALITGRFPDKEPTLKELEEMELDKWNYPLTEIDHIMENEIPVVLVRFPSVNGWYDYRFCEVEAD